jgi:hypothetical protein
MKGWIVGAVVVSVVLLFVFGNRRPDRPASPDEVASQYGGCAIKFMGRRRYSLDCPNEDAFTAAVVEIRQKNPTYNIIGIVAEPR